MKKVYETVSELLLPAAVFLAVMAILAGAAVFNRIGKRMEVPGEDYALMGDTQAVQSLCERESPKIWCAGKKRWNAGEVISVSEVFASADAEGNGLEVTVVDITDQDGISEAGCYQEETGQAVFPVRGVYTFSLLAMDGERKRSIERISLLVDGK